MNFSLYCMQISTKMITSSLIMLSIASPFAVHAQGTLRHDVNQLADIVEDLLPTVVSVDTRGSIGGTDDMFDGFDGQDIPRNFRDYMERLHPRGERKTSGGGSGFIVSDEFIVTNHHVIENADDVRVTLHDGTQLDAEIWASDLETDLAVLKIDPEGRDLSEIEWGNSRVLRVGEWLVAIGNPFGIGSTVTTGIVSAKGRSINSGPYDQFIQTDASINRGNSGGPSFNIQGEVVGVNSAIFSPNGASVGIGFAIPSRIAKRVVEDLIKEREVVRGFIGVSIGDLNQELVSSLGLENTNGAVVRAIGPGGPADKAGIEPGDVIIEFNGLPINSVRDVTTVVAETNVGAEITVEVVRNGQKTVLPISVARRTPAALANLRPEDYNEMGPSTDKSVSPLSRFGLDVEMLGANELASLGFPRYRRALRIVGMDENAIFSRRELNVGDIIVEIEQKKVKSANQVSDVIENVLSSDASLVTMIIVRNGQRNWIAPYIQK